MNYPQVAIIILNFNGLQDTRKCLKTLLKTSYKNFIVTVVDNGSRENEAKILAKEFRSKKIIFRRFENNYGFTGGNNKIFPLLKQKYIVLLNNDVEVPVNWLTPLVDVLEKHRKVAIVQPKILWQRNKKYFDYAGACGGFIDILGYPFTKGRIFNALEKDMGQYDSISDIFWASGAAVMMRKSILDTVGYFDKSFFNYMEEIDLCFRVRRKGFRIVCEPKSYVYHKVGGTSSRNELKKRFWEHRNNLLLIVKNYPLRHLIYILPIRIVLEYLSILYYLSINRFDYVTAVLFSQGAFYFMGTPILIDRIKHKNKERITLDSLIYPRSIVLSYFFFGKKTFSSIFPQYTNFIQ